MSSACPSTCSAQTRYQQHTAGGGVLRKPFCHSVQPFLVSRRTHCHRPACVTLSCRHDQTCPRTSQVAPRKQSQQHKDEALFGTALKAVAVLAALTFSSSSPALAELQARGFALQELSSLLQHGALHNSLYAGCRLFLPVRPQSLPSLYQNKRQTRDLWLCCLLVEPHRYLRQQSCWRRTPLCFLPFTKQIKS